MQIFVKTISTQDQMRTRKLLGNVVISKKILRTRKTMVMHSNERGRVCLHTLGDQKRSILQPVDVIELLLVPTNQAPNVRYLRVLHTLSSMTSLELLIWQSVKEVDEFHQLNGVVMVM